MAESHPAVGGGHLGMRKNFEFLFLEIMMPSSEEGGLNSLNILNDLLVCGVPGIDVMGHFLSREGTASPVSLLFLGGFFSLGLMVG